MRTPHEAAVFVYKTDRFLVMHRALEGYWHVVAGVVEPAETYPGAAARELREETGLEASGPLLDLSRPQTYALPDELRDQYPPGTTEVVVQSFAIKAPAGWEPVLNEEHDRYRWCTFDEAISILHWPEARAALRALAEKLRDARSPLARSDGEPLS